MSSARYSISCRSTFPKPIVNTAIQGKGFSGAGASVPFFAIAFTWPSFLAPLGLTGQATIFHGIELERIPYLIAITTLFLIMVLINNAFKYQVNTQKGRLGERMLRRLRFELLDRILRFPPSAPAQASSRPRSRP